MQLNKVSEDISTITFGWTPPDDAAHYLFYVQGTKVSNAQAVDKNGDEKTTVRFSKSGEPYEVVCVKGYPGAFKLDVGRYPTNVAVSAPTEVIG